MNIALGKIFLIGASTKLSYPLLILVAISGCSPQQTAEERLEAYAKRISESFSPPNDVAYRSLKKTMDEPLRAYVLYFKTQDANFKSVPDASTNRVSFAVNTGRRLVWETKFCTDELRQILIKGKNNLVSGQILDNSGKTQFIASCPINMNR